jgi:hypothetical protein
MRKLLPLALVATSLCLALPGNASAAPKAQATILGIVSVSGNEATVRARYVCYEAKHLWVSAKQTASGRRDPALEQENSSAAAANWMDTNVWGSGPPFSTGDAQLRCDGRKRTDTFTIRTSSAPWGSWGALKKGMAWVQFCITPSPGQNSQEFATDQRWVTVK